MHTINGEVSPISTAAKWGWIPFPLLITAIGVANIASKDGTVFEPPLLLPILNFVFLTAISLFIAYVAAHSYVRSGQRLILLLGCGMLMLSLISLFASLAIYAGAHNLALTSYNSGLLLFAICNGLAAIMAMAGVVDNGSHRGFTVLLTYAAVVTVVGLLLLASFEGMLPVYFTEGSGGTTFRQAILGLTVGILSCACAVLFSAAMRRKWEFGYWYGYALGLIALGVIAIMMSDRLGNPVGWVGRFSQYLGSVYLLVAVLISARQSGIWMSPVQLALEHSEARFELLAQATSEGILISQKGVIVDCNNQAAKMLGWGIDSLTGRHLDEVLPTLWTNSNGKPEVQVKLSDGRTTVLEVSARALREGKNDLHVCILRDITERIAAEEALRNSEVQLRLIVNHSRDGIHRFDLRKRKYTFLSPALEDLTGFGVVELMMMSDDDFFSRVHPDDRENYREYLTEVTASDEKRPPVTYRWRIKSGEYRWISDTRRAIRDDEGHATALIGVSRDITSHVEAEEELRRSRHELEQRVHERTVELRERADQLARLAGELALVEQRERHRLAQVLHDHLQQLLVAARMRLVLLRRNLAENQHGALADVAELISESIDASRSLTVELSPPILHQGGLQAGIEWLKRWMQDKHGFNVDIEVRQGLPDEPEEIRVLIFQAVRELLLNATKHSGETEAKVILDGRPDLLMITVSDEGVGFEPTSNPRRDPEQRSGFGLFSIRERLVMIGGNIEIDSSPGNGSRFILRVPRKPAERASGQELEPSDAQLIQQNDNRQPRQALRVLLVDDHVMMRQGLASLLGEEEDVIVVGEGTNGREAVELARRLQPDLILMDISMPEMDGIEATRQICAELGDVPIIGLSMFDEEDRAAAMIAAGARAYLTKSGDLDRLLLEIRNLAAATV